MGTCECKNETSYVMWNAVVSAAADIRHIIDDDKELGENFRTVMRDVLTPIYESLKWECKEDEDETRSGLLRPLVIAALGGYESQHVIDEAKKRFASFMKTNDGKALPANLRSVVFSLAVKFGET